MSWMEDILDQLRQQTTNDQQIWTTSTSSQNIPIVCEFCGKPYVDNIPFGNTRFNDWVMCNTCNAKLKKRIKLILKFE